MAELRMDKYFFIKGRLQHQIFELQKMINFYDQQSNFLYGYDTKLENAKKRLARLECTKEGVHYRTQMAKIPYFLLKDSLGEDKNVRNNQNAI